MPSAGQSDWSAAAAYYAETAAKLTSLKERCAARFAASCDSLHAKIDELKAALDARCAAVIAEGREALKATLKALDARIDEAIVTSGQLSALGAKIRRID